MTGPTAGDGEGAAPAPTGPPLSGVRVLDLTTFLSGPFCTQVLGDLGADVIKVEHPDGDMTRHIPPYFVGDDSAYYLSTNRNKRSVVVDMKTPGGLDLVAQLARRSDVLVENFRPGVMERLGYGWEAAAAQHPGLVWCAISGFGQDGPYRDLPAYDMVVQAIAGVMSLTGEPGRGPVRTGVPLSDLVGGMFGVIAVLAALHERARSGRGQYIDVSLLDAQLPMLSYQAVYHLVSGVTPGRQGAGHDSIPTYRAFVAGDGVDLVVTANTERMWQALCRVVGHPELLGDERFADQASRYANRHALWAILEPAFTSRTAAEWVALLRPAGVPAAVVNTVEGALADEHVRHRNMIVELRGDDGRTVRVPGDPVRMSRSRLASHRYPPGLGQDTAAVLTEVLGCSEETVERLYAEGAVAGPGRPGHPGHPGRDEDDARARQGDPAGR